MKPIHVVTACCTIIALMAGTYGLCSQYGRGARIWFSPDTLETLVQRELVLPIFEVPIYRSRVEASERTLILYLVDGGYWTPQYSDKSPILIERWNMQWRGGESAFVSALWRDRELIEWTEKHPEFARQFWPEVLNRMRSNPLALHYETAVLLRVVTDCDSEDELREYLERFPEVDW